jgi:uncharacterized membrane protein YbhN (UPF0104 family)
MKLSRLAWGYGLIIAIYLAMLLVVDTQKGFFEYVPTAMAQLPVLLLFALTSFVLRYARWFWLLRWAGSEVPVWQGWLAYLSGFAFTATPGKVGELVRIRYFGRLNVEGSRVMSAFVFERALDLVVVFCLATLWVVDTQMFVVAATFVLVFLVLVGLVIYKPMTLDALGMALIGYGFGRVGRLLRFVAQAMAGCVVWLRPVPVMSSLLLGLGAWCSIALAFVFLLNEMQLHVPFLAAFAAYPLAMLAGAASMLPGGVGSTEAAIVFQLQWHGVPLATALLVAVVIRLGTMWIAVVCGLFAILLQELHVYCKNSS